MLFLMWECGVLCCNTDFSWQAFNRPKSWKWLYVPKF